MTQYMEYMVGPAPAEIEQVSRPSSALDAADATSKYRDFGRRDCIAMSHDCHTIEAVYLAKRS